MSLPGVAAVVADLRQVVRYGLGSLDETVQLPTLTGLECVKREASGPEPLGLILAVEVVVTRAIEMLEGTDAYQVVRPLFALEPATVGMQAKQRRKLAADRARVDPQTFVRHDEQRFLRLLARRVLYQETRFRETQARLGPPPSLEEIRGSWLVRFQHYRRMADACRQLRFNLLAVSPIGSWDALADKASEVDFVHAAIWHYTRFLATYETFLRELGALWLMPELDQEAALGNAVNLIRWHTPYNERGDSYLRTSLADVTAEELYPFIQRLQDGPEGTEMLGIWVAWLEECKCDSEFPSADCGIHELMRQCDRLGEVVEEGWEMVGGRYRQLPGGGVFDGSG